MTALGQSRRFDLLSITSGLPPTSDVFGPNRHFAFVPRADILGQSKWCHVFLMAVWCHVFLMAVWWSRHEDDEAAVCARSLEVGQTTDCLLNDLASFGWSYPVERPRASQTAVRVALQRAAHQVLDGEPRIFIDPVAVGLFPEATEAAIRADAARLLESGWRRIRANFVVRSRHAEDCLSEAVERGVDQYVILGAGLDTFAYRQPSWARTLCIVEIDQPASQAYKQECLRIAGVKIPDNLHFLPVDFRVDLLAQRLDAAPLQKDKPIFVSWLGVTQYLPIEAITQTLRAVASWSRHCEMVFGYIESDWSSLDPVGRKSMEDAMSRATASGEPWVSRFTSQQMVELLRSCGFDEMTHFSMDDAREKYFSGRTDGLTPAGGIAMVLART